MEDSGIYFRRREQEEFKAAASARTAAAQKVHLELSRLYGNAAEAVGLDEVSSSPWGAVKAEKTAQ